MPDQRRASRCVVTARDEFRERLRADLKAARDAGLTLRHYQRLAYVSERDLQRTVIDACNALQLLHYHTRDSRGSVAGFPDLVVVGPRGVLWRELKAEQGRLTKDQRRWLGALQTAGCDAAIWRPADLDSGRVLRELRALWEAP